MRRLFISIVFTQLAACACMSQTSPYSAWTNFPQSSSFFPRAIWEQDPTWPLGTGAPYSSFAAAMAGTKINVVLQVENASPTTFGVDPGGRYQTLITNGIYFIPVVDQTGNTSPTSIASYEAIASAESGSQYLIGYNLGDEPTCTQESTFPAVTSLLIGFDSTRPLFWNFTDWPFAHGGCYPASSAANLTALQDISIGSFDLYPLTSAWNGTTTTGANIPLVAGQPGDSMWIQGWSVEQFIDNGRTSERAWAYVDTGTNELAYSSSNGSTCVTATNLCQGSGFNNEYRAPAEQVNAEVWMSIINGAMGIEYFCDDTSLTTGETAYNFCLGSTTSGEGSVAAAIASNLAYINGTIETFAPQLNSPVSGVCTMNNGLTYTSHATSCSNGILTMSTGTSTVPGSGIVKNYDGTLYLFADSDRNGSATMTFTLSGYAGAKATVVYDSDAQYDPSHSSVGATFTLNASGQFSDTFGANGDNYQPKIYTISSAGPAAPSGLKASVN